MHVPAWFDTLGSLNREFSATQISNTMPLHMLVEGYVIADDELIAILSWSFLAADIRSSAVFREEDFRSCLKPSQILAPHVCFSILVLPKHGGSCFLLRVWWPWRDGVLGVGLGVDGAEVEIGGDNVDWIASASGLRL